MKELINLTSVENFNVLNGLFETAIKARLYIHAEGWLSDMNACIGRLEADVSIFHNRSVREDIRKRGGFTDLR